MLLTTSGEVSSIEVENTVRALWGLVGGYVQRIELRDGADLFATRESQGLPRNRNEAADRLLAAFAKKPSRLVVVGNALVLGEIEPSGDSTDVPGWVREYLAKER
jgi:hypothetical protein